MNKTELSTTEKPLFIPLMTEHYENFKSGVKKG